MTVATRNPILAAALAHAAAGRPVFPADPQPDAPGTPAGRKRAKRPLVPGEDKDADGRPIPRTGGHWRATTDADQIRRWWRTRPDALIGLPTGTRSGLLVIDLDPDGEDVEATEARLVAAVGPLPPCPRARTQSGGRHLYFRLPAGVEAPRNSAKRLVNIDWRGEGGYVIVPPSVMRDGAAYEWLVDLDAVEPPEPPPRLVDLVMQRGAFARGRAVAEERGSGLAPAGPGAGAAGLGDEPGDRQVRLYALATLDRARGDVAATPKGGRGHELNAAAFGMAPFVALGVLSEREVHDALMAAAEACGLAATDGAKECRAKIARGLAAGAGRTGALAEKIAGIRREAAESGARRARRGERPPEPPPLLDVPEAARRDGGAGADDADGDEDGDDVAAKLDRHVAERRPRGQKVGGYDVEWMNERYALVMMGSKALIMSKNPDAPLEDRHAVRSIEAFGAWFSNRFVMATVNGQTRAVTWASKWMMDPRRRQYSGIVFHPAPDETAPAPAGYFNLWRGFSVEPRCKPNGWAIFRDHLLNNICGGRDDYFRFVFGWIAHMMQRPRERIGTALVLRGKMGTGKSKVGEIVGAMIKAHYFLVDDPRYVTGNFNSHMASCILLQADEAVWAGDKTAEGRLKGLITASTQMIEAKGVDPVRVDNYVRLLMTSNEGWVVPAGKDERRYAVFDVSDRCAQNAGYFAEMDAEMRAGGYEALLFDLLQFDLSTVDLRRIPRTEALLEQKIRTLDSVESWWFERLSAGRATRKHVDWPDAIDRDDVFDDYVATAERIGVRRKAADNEVGTTLRRLCPAIRTWRPRRKNEAGKTDRSRYYLLPPLAECRAAFEAAVGQQVDWQDDEREDLPDAGPGEDGEF